MAQDSIVGGYIHSDGSRYLGAWNDRLEHHGVGSMKLLDKSFLQAQFKHNLVTGLGIVIFPDGAKYEGELHEGWFHGYGVFWRADGMRYEGQFRGGRVWGLGLITFSDGTHGYPRHEGFFQDCRFIRSERCPKVFQKAQKIAFQARIIHKFEEN